MAFVLRGMDQMKGHVQRLGRWLPCCPEPRERGHVAGPGQSQLGREVHLVPGGLPSFLAISPCCLFSTSGCCWKVNSLAHPHSILASQPWQAGPVAPNSQRLCQSSIKSRV